MRPVFPWVVSISLVVFGFIAFKKLGISQLPDIYFPIVTVSVVYEGASPEVIEAEVLDKLEQKFLGLDGIINIKSQAQTGVGTVTLEFDIKRDIEDAFSDVQAALAQVRLPAGVIERPTVRKQNPEEEPIMFMAFWAPTDLKNLAAFVEWTVLPELQSVPGVGEVSIAGFSVRNLRIWIDIKKLTAADLTVLDIIDAIQSQHHEPPVGYLTNKQQERNIRLLGETQSVEEMKNLAILRRGGQRLHDRIYRLKDFADVEIGLSDIRRIAEYDGKTAISILVRKQRGIDEVDLGERLTRKFESLKQKLPSEYGARINVDYTKITKAAVDATIQKLILVTIITIVVVFLFLGSWVSSFNILLAIPVSIVGSFLFILWFGFTLNLFTLLALAIVVSIVIDDAILVLENIIRHYREKRVGPFEAAYYGTWEVFGATVASTISIAAVFVPVLFMDGVTGKFLYQFGVVASVAVILSLVDALTITPMRAHQMLIRGQGNSRFEQKIDDFFHHLSAGYGYLLRFTLKAPLVTVLVGLFIFLVSLNLIRVIKKELVPEQDQNFIILSFQTDLNTAVEKTYEKGKEIVQIVQSLPEVEGFFLSVGAGGPSSFANQGFIPIILQDSTRRQRNHRQIMEELRTQLRKLKGVRAQVRDVSARGLTSGRLVPVNFTLRGPDLDELNRLSREIMERLEKEGLAQDLDSDFKKGIQEIQINLKRDLMAERGISVDMVGRTLQALVNGLVVGQFSREGRRFDIRIKGKPEQLLTPEDFRHIKIRNLAGNLESLGPYLDIRTQEVTQAINRVNRNRSITVFGSLKPGISQGQALERAQQIAGELLPPEYTFSLEGSSRQLQESLKSFYVALLLGLLVAYLVLAIQYNSFVHPITVLMALPFAITGSAITLWAFGDSLNLYSLMGMVALMGIAKKNSIILVDFFLQRQQVTSRSLRDDIVEASQVRLRPILMTSMTTFLGAVPLLFKGGIGYETARSLGLAVTGGVLVSTLITLFVIPNFFCLISNKRA